MSTANALKAHENRIRERQAKEEERHNRQQEKIAKVKAIADTVVGGVGAATGGFGNVAKGISALAKTAKSANDPRWYKLNPILSDRAAKLSFNVISGLSRDIASFGSGAERMAVNSAMVPLFPSSMRFVGTGVATLEYVPTIGGAITTTNLTTSPFVQVCRRLMSAVRQAIGPGPKSYDDINLGMTLFTLAEAYAFIEYIKRGLRIAMTFSGANRSYGKFLCAAGGYDFDSFSLNINDSIKALNAAIVQLNSCPIPDNFSLVLRHAWMNGSVFKDADTDKAQLYIFKPKCYFTYDDINSKVISHIIFPHNSTTVYTFQTLMGYLQDILTSVLDSTDVALMRGDLAITYAKSGNPLSGRALQYGLITELSPIEAEYVPEVLEQIHNTSICGSYASETNDCYTIREFTYNSVQYAGQGLPFLNNGAADNHNYWGPSGDVLCMIPCGRASGVMGPGIVMLNSRENNPNEDTVLVDTRLKVTKNMTPSAEFLPSLSPEEYVPYIEYCGSEAVMEITLWHRGMGTQAINAATMHGNLLFPATTLLDAAYLSLVSQFDWFPILMLRGLSDNSTYFYYGDVNNYAFYTAAWLHDIHLACLYSLYGVQFDA